MKKIRHALGQSISGTCASANRKIGERKNEKGILNNLIVEELSMIVALTHIITSKNRA